MIIELTYENNCAIIDFFHLSKIVFLPIAIDK